MDLVFCFEMGNQNPKILNVCSTYSISLQLVRYPISDEASKAADGGLDRGLVDNN